jgi:hypothetical protein
LPNLQSKQGEQTSERPDGVMAKSLPKAARKEADSYRKTYNKDLKSVIKSPEVKSDISKHVAVNKSGGKKPFSKNSFLPSSPKVPTKGKKK